MWSNDFTRNATATNAVISPVLFCPGTWNHAMGGGDERDTIASSICASGQALSVIAKQKNPGLI